MDTENHGVESFDHVPSPAELMQLYAQSEENDPRSLFYKRQLVRPKLPVARLILAALLGVGVCAAAGIGIGLLTASLFWAVLSGMALFLAVCLVFAKHILIWAVKLYQALAPERIRKRCRYEPSCSVYMLLCVEKLGVWKGLKKGLTRWAGCKPPNGGYDWP